MNAWSARNAMSGSNKRLVWLQHAVLTIANAVLLSLFILFCPLPSFGASAPSMTGVQEVLLQYVRFASDRTEESCGLTRGEMEKNILKALTVVGIPVVPVIDAKPPMLGVARIELLPEVVSLGGNATECTSWVSLTAQTQNTLTIAPVAIPRSVTIIYFKSGLLLNSSVTSHAQIVGEAFGKLADQFGRRFKLDQPPPLPDFDEKK